MHCTEFVPFIAVLGVLVVLCWEKIRKEPLLSGLIGAHRSQTALNRVYPPINVLPSV